VVAPSSILESSTDAPADRQLKNLKFQTPLATTKNGFPDTLLGVKASPLVFFWVLMLMNLRPTYELEKRIWTLAKLHKMNPLLSPSAR
ncbi:MAG: hypothetical protein WBH28_02970, partial [Fuerstiella sp.]